MESQALAEKENIRNHISSNSKQMIIGTDNIKLLVQVVRTKDQKTGETHLSQSI